MSSNDQNRINDDAYVAILNALDAAAVGTTDDLVASFSAFVATDDRGNIPVAQWLTRVESAAFGTTLQINRRGIYQVSAFVPILAMANLKAAISLDATVAERQTDFVVSSPSIWSFGQAVTGVGNQESITVSAPIPIQQRIADSTTLGFIRLQLGDTAGGPPTATEIDVANVFLSITRISDLLAA